MGDTRYFLLSTSPAKRSHRPDKLSLQSSKIRCDESSLCSFFPWQPCNPLKTCEHQPTRLLFPERFHRESLPPLKITATNNFLGSSSQRTMRGDGRHLTTSDTDSVVTAPRKPHSKHRNSGAKGRQPDTRIECRVSTPNRWMGGWREEGRKGETRKEGNSKQKNTLPPKHSLFSCAC